MRALPDMTVLAPGDPGDACSAHARAFRHDGPVYLRLGKNGEPERGAAEQPVRLGRASIRVRDGDDVTSLSTGAILPEAVVAVDAAARPRHRRRRCSTSARSSRSTPPRSSPPPPAARVVTVEEHTDRRRPRQRGRRGAGRGRRRRHACAASACPTTFAHAVGSRDHLITHYGARADAVAGPRGSCSREEPER